MFFEMLNLKIYIYNKQKENKNKKEENEVPFDTANWAGTITQPFGAGETECSVIKFHLQNLIYAINCLTECEMELCSLNEF